VVVDAGAAFTLRTVAGPAVRQTCPWTPTMRKSMAPRTTSATSTRPRT